MQYAAFFSSLSTNAGDAIQTVAAMRFLPRMDTFIDRDNLQSYSVSPPTFYIGNGWYSNNADCFPPPDNLQPFYISFHWHPAIDASSTALKHLKGNEPIGTRDEHTCHWLKQQGIDAYLSGCLTLTLERPTLPRGDAILMVDVYQPYKNCIPERLRKNAVSLSHTHRKMTSCSIEKVAWAKLNRYATARLVITSRLHAALPCIAFGTPVVLLADRYDIRFAGVCPGLKAQTPEEHIDWNPPPVDIQRQKQDLIDRCVSAVHDAKMKVS
jgi:hypothetical protein